LFPFLSSLLYVLCCLLFVSLQLKTLHAMQTPFWHSFLCFGLVGNAHTYGVHVL
jgi:hypothetical protein